MKPTAVVSYSISTSNHNYRGVSTLDAWVVSYSISTSNHNLSQSNLSKFEVVSYSISTSNHNRQLSDFYSAQLYLIPFLHQTTTCIANVVSSMSCILFHFYIKPQHS